VYTNVRIRDRTWITVAADDETSPGQAVACVDIRAEKRIERSLRVDSYAREKSLKLWALFASNIHPVVIRLLRVRHFRIAKLNNIRAAHYRGVYPSTQQHRGCPTGFHAEAKSGQLTGINS
jgi:hypothetical protein